ncbi:MAG: hypothetical protein QMB78_06635, partial [Rhodospirillales bacterium]
SGTGTAPQSYRFYLAKWLEDNVPEGLAVLTLHSHRLSTSNPIERGIQKKTPASHQQGPRLSEHRIS